VRERILETVEVVSFLFTYIISFYLSAPPKKKKTKVEPTLRTDLN